MTNRNSYPIVPGYFGPTRKRDCTLRFEATKQQSGESDGPAFHEGEGRDARGTWASKTGMCPRPSEDTWPFGGGLLFRSLLEARLVDAVEASVVPVLLGEGIPLLPPKTSSERFRLKLASSRAFKSGIVSLEYAVEYDPA